MDRDSDEYGDRQDQPRGRGAPRSYHGGRGGRSNRGQAKGSRGYHSGPRSDLRSVLQTITSQLTTLTTRVDQMSAGRDVLPPNDRESKISSSNPSATHTSSGVQGNQSPGGQLLSSVIVDLTESAQKLTLNREAGRGSVHQNTQVNKSVPLNREDGHDSGFPLTQGGKRKALDHEDGHSDEQQTRGRTTRRGNRSFRTRGNSKRSNKGGWHNHPDNGQERQNSVSRGGRGRNRYWNRRRSYDNSNSRNRDNKSQPRRSSSGPGSRKPGTQSVPNTNPDTRPRVSENCDFERLTKSLYHIMQIRHHQRNWLDLPEAMTRSIDNFIASICLPMPDDEVSQELQNFGKQIGQQLCKLAQGHLARTQQRVIETCKDLDHTDLTKAASIASKYSQKRLGSRLSTERCQEIMSEAVIALGGQIHMDQTEPAVDPEQPRVSKLFESVSRDLTSTQTITIQDSSNTEDAAFERPSLPPPRKKAKRVRISSPPTTSVADTMDTDPPVTTAGVQLPTLDLQAPPGAYSEDDEDMLADTPPGIEPSQRPHPGSLRIRKSSGVLLYTSDRDSWKIVPDDTTNIIVVADSNMRDIPLVPIGVEVHVMPGATIEHAADAVARMQVDHPCTVVIQCGINNRRSTRAQVDSELAWLRRSLKDTYKVRRAYFLGLSAPMSLPDEESDTISYINECMERHLGDRYLSPLPRGQVRISPKDRFGIHHTQASIAQIMAELVTALANDNDSGFRPPRVLENNT